MRCAVFIVFLSMLLLSSTAGAQLTIVQQPVGAAVYVGQPVTFSVAVTGNTGPCTYLWLKDGTAPVGSEAALMIASTASADAGYYRCSVSDSLDTVVSDNVLLRVGDPLVFMQQPASAAVYVGDPVTFSVTAVGGVGPTYYQWRVYKGGLWVATGANANTLAIASVTLADSGLYRCEVIDDVCVTSSTAAQLTVQEPEPLLIVQQPASASVFVGQPAAFSVSVTGGTGAYDYQWFMNGMLIFGESNPTLTIGSATLADSGSYTCVVTGSAESVESNAAQLTVFNPLVIVQQPISAYFAVGQSITFNVTAMGGIGPLTYEWVKDGSGTVGSSPALTIASATPADAGSYQCLISDSLSTVRSVAAQLVSVTPNTSAPVIDLNLPNPVLLEQGNPYLEPGFTATDNEDGDLTGSIVVEGAADVQVPGVCHILYRVIDSDNNLTVAERLVFVEPAQPVVEQLDEAGGNVEFPGAEFTILPGQLVGESSFSMDRIPPPAVPRDADVRVVSDISSYTVTGLEALDSNARVTFVISYADGDNDGVVDGTTCPEEQLVALVFDSSGKMHIIRGVVDPVLNTLTVQIPAGLAGQAKASGITVTLGLQSEAKLPLSFAPVIAALASAALYRIRRRIQ